MNNTLALLRIAPCSYLSFATYDDKRIAPRLRAPAILQALALSRCFASLPARTCHSLEKDAVATRKALVAPGSLLPVIPTMITNCSALRAPAILQALALSRCFASLPARTCHSLVKKPGATRKTLVAPGFFTPRNTYDDNELLRASRSRNSTSTRTLALLRIAPCSYLSFARKRCVGNKKGTCCPPPLYSLIYHLSIYTATGITAFQSLYS